MHLNIAASGNAWALGAALSFKPFSSFYCDYFYQSSGTHYALRGSTLHYSYGCGIFDISLNIAFSATGWYRGAALLFKRNSLFLL